MADLLDGKALSVRLNRALKSRVDERKRPPGLAVILVGMDPASEVYVSMKGRVASRIGYFHRQISVKQNIDQQALLALIDELNADSNVDGILVQLPLPKHLDSIQVMERIDPSKDVDGFSAINSGLLAQGRPRFVPCTPWGVMRILHDSDVELSGKRAVVIGRSNIVGRPMALLLEQANCTVTVCHSRTQDVARHVGAADIVVAAVGRPGFVKGEWLQKGAIVIDVGVNRLDDNRLVGDVDFDSAVSRARLITPVPGGVGPMTIAMLMENTWRAYCWREGISSGF
jgi:methylenetetrahydrofolate dehydrogenase (NADP+)/methenyltetrahydrofolate cyclohydrolase